VVFYFLVRVPSGENDLPEIPKSGHGNQPPARTNAALQPKNARNSSVSRMHDSTYWSVCHKNFFYRRILIQNNHNISYYGRTFSQRICEFPVVDVSRCYSRQDGCAARVCTG
jgi:hypothetical protein